MADSELMLVLAAQAWQVTVLIVLVAGVNRWLGKSRPHLSHLLWLVVLVKCVAPPMWCSPSGLFCWLQSPREVVIEQPHVAAKQSLRNWNELLDATRDLEQSRSNESDDHGFSELSGEPVESLLGISDLSVVKAQPHIIASPISWPRALLGLWIAASFGVISVAVVRWLRCWRTLQSTPQRECSELVAQLEVLAERLRVRRHVRLIVTESRIGPAVIGLFRTTVLLPALIVDRLALGSRHAPGDEQDAHQRLQKRPVHHAKLDSYAEDFVDSPLTPILAHELLHIRRGTYGSGCYRRWHRRCGGVIRWCGG